MLPCASLSRPVPQFALAVAVVVKVITLSGWITASSLPVAAATPVPAPAPTAVPIRAPRREGRLILSMPFD
jgi:hypothetical protein